MAAPLVDANELARRLHVTPATVRSWARRGIIPRIEVTPRVIRFDPEAIARRLAGTTRCPPLQADPSKLE